MQKPKKRRSRFFYIPWYSKDKEAADEEDEDSWVSYIRRNLPHSSDEESPFPDSSWSYTTHDSPFEQDEGPKKLSDESIREDVLDALYQSADVDASHIKVIVMNGIVSLLGTVDSLHAKREAQRIVMNLPGVWTVHNEIEVIVPKNQSFAA